MPSDIRRKLRTRALWLILRAVPLERRQAWRNNGILRLLGPIIGRGEIGVLGGLAARGLLDASAFSVAGAQAFPVLAGTHEVQVQQALVRSAGAGDVIWDVGANIGYMTLVAARIVGPGGRVVAIEPDPACAAALRRMVELNRLDGVMVVEAAASDTTGSAELTLVEDPLWNRLSTVGDHELATARMTVATVALDDLDAPPPRVVKIDVEGAELDVLAGMRRMLDEVRPVVICEMHGKNRAFCEWMRGAGYTVRNLDGPEPVEEAGGNVQAICEPLRS